MGKLFNYDGPVFQFLIKMVDCLWLNILWLLFCLPVVTIGASTTAFYFTAKKVLGNKRGYVWSEFWNAFKLNFKQSTVVWLINLLVGVIVFVDGSYAYELNRLGMIPKLPLIFIVVGAVVLIMWGIYIFPYIARFTSPTKYVYKNTFLMMIVNFGWSLLLLFLFALAVILIQIPLAILFVPVAYMIYASKIIERVFRKYMTPEDLAAEIERDL